MAAKTAEAMRDLRRESDLSAESADAVGVSVARMIEDAADRVADRLLVRLGGLMVALSAIVISALSLRIG